jgi:exopolysaccharide production protein ExoQ
VNDRPVPTTDAVTDYTEVRGIDVGAGWSWPLLPPRRIEPLWVTAAVVFIVLVFATELADALFSSTQEGRSPIVQLLYFSIYVLSALLLVMSRGLTRVFTLTPLLALTMFMVPISLLWSVEPAETLQRSVALIGTCLFGVYLGWRFTLGHLIFLLAVGLSLAAALALLAIVFVPSIGIEHSGPWAGTWKGLSSHKNGLGSISALGCIVIGYAIADSRGWTRLSFVGCFLMAALLLVGSRSTTSLLAMLAICAMALWARHLQKLPKQVPVLTFIAVFAVLFLGIELLSKGLLESGLALFGKRADLSSRVPLWSLVWNEFITERFWLGYGYEAFWIPGSSRVLAVERKLYFTPFYSHNGMLETWLNGGLVLVALAATVLVGLIARAAILMVRWRSLAISSFPLIFAAFFVLMNFTESFILARNDLLWAIFVALAVFLAKSLRFRIL